MQDHENADPIAFKRVPWNKGKLTGAKPPLRPKHVWSGPSCRSRDGCATWQCSIWPSIASSVAAMLSPSRWRMSRPAGTQSIGRGRRKPAASPVRVDGTDSPSCRRLPESRRQKAGRIYVHRPAGAGKEHHDEAVRAPRLRVDCRHQPGSTPFRYALTPSDQGDPHLPTHRQFARRAAPARPHHDRKYRQVPRHRG
jgi:hypothetical protein